GENRPSGSRRPRRAAMLREFKEFLFRGNIVELAVAFVMGVAFAAVINSLVENLVMPVIAAVVGKPVDAMLARRKREPVEEGMPDEERRHQELLAALARVGR